MGLPILHGTRFVLGLTLAAVTPVPAPLFDVAENRSLRVPSQDVSLKYKWQRMKTMMSLLLTTTFYFDWLACGHHCKSVEVKVANGNKI